MFRVLGIVAVSSMLLSPAAYAQTADERAACQDDFKKFCPNVMPGGGRIIACLAQHKEKLSPACMKVVESHGQ
ncbi:MAG: cysteine rich repeat-containing protein [Xanthobacteraceae bacterium]|nr:cysteine rich repeat-containing protein [Xanthobacteraceae bacterium]